MSDFQDFGFNSSLEQDRFDENGSDSDSKSTTSEEEIESGDEDQNGQQDFELTKEVGDIASLIACNQTYLDLIERLISKVENLLENNKDEQKKIKQFLGTKKPGDRSVVPIYRAVFLPPYFKDTFNMISGLNDESRAIRSQCTVNPLIKEDRPWSKEDLRLLKKSVAAQLTEIKNKETLAKRDALRNKIVQYKAEDKIEQLTKWKEELSNVMRRLNYINSKDEDSELKSSSFEDIDWAKIAFREFKGSRTPLQLKMKWLYEQAPQWNNSAWTKSEDDALKKLAGTPWQNWDFVASKIDTKRSAFMYFERFHYLNKKISSKRPWTTREDEKLLALIDRFSVDNTISWKKIATHMPERNRIQCETRYNRSLNPNLVHGRWTEEEDMLLIACVNKYGPHDWQRIAQSVPGRTDVQCRARWVDNLDYKRSKAPWSLDEDEAILVGIQVFGRSNYSSIAKLLPGRNTSAVKIRIRTLIRWKIVENKKKDKSTVSSSGLGQMMDSTKVRPEEALKRFNEVMEMSQRMSTNQHGFLLARRLGYGNYVVKNGEKNPDYSDMKQKLNDNFGKWYISKNGRWVRLGKNPNEFGKDELDSVMVDLPEDKQQILSRFLKDRSERRMQSQKRILSEEEQTARKNEQAARIANLMDTVLILDQKDIDMNNKKQLSARFDPLKLPFRQDDRKKTKRLGKRLNDSFSSLINDLAPRRYSMADRLTAEITYKLDRLPKNERRGFILNLMCEMLSSQMEAEVQKHIGTLPKPILNVKILNYLQSMLSKEAIKQTENSSDSLLDNSFEQMEENNAMALTNPKAASSSCAEEPESALQQTLQNLVIPSNANSSALFHYTNIIRPMLTKRAKILFPILNEELQPASSLEDNGAFMDIQLSNEERMMRLFLLPMLFKRAIESESVRLARSLVREGHCAFKDLQQSKLEERGVHLDGNIFTKQDGESMTNEQIVKSLNESLPFQVYNPQLKKKLPIADSPPVDAQARKRKQPQNIFPVHTPITSQFQNIPPVVAFNLIAPLIQATPIASTSNAQQTNGFIQQPQILLQPSGIIQYRPRNKTCSTTTPNTTDLSVRDFILMRQMPTTNSDAQQQPAKKKRLD